MPPLCPLCLCGEFLLEFINHRDTEDAEVCTEKSAIETLCVKLFVGFHARLCGTFRMNPLAVLQFLALLRGMFIAHL